MLVVVEEAPVDLVRLWSDYLHVVRLPAGAQIDLAFLLNNEVLINWLVLH